MRDGQVLNIRLAESSGSEEVDRAAFAAVQSANDLEPLPAEFDGPSIDIHFIFNLKITRGASANMGS